MHGDEVAAGRRMRQQMVRELVQQCTDHTFAFVTDFSGLSVPENEVLRRQLRDVSARYVVGKRRLWSRAVDPVTWPGIESLLNGACGITVGEGEPVSISKVLVEFQQDHPTFIIRGGMLDNMLLTADRVNDLAALPSRDQLRAQVVVGVASPLSGLAGALQGVVRKLANVLDLIAQRGS